ncbi:hypothetical protein HDU82_002248 [Entophlyctis luteolus]|nr:hypothetical protein HDU82_002248 [Entophlyctis luteolus]
MKIINSRKPVKGHSDQQTQYQQRLDNFLSNVAASVSIAVGSTGSYTPASSTTSSHHVPSFINPYATAGIPGIINPSPYHQHIYHIHNTAGIPMPAAQTQVFVSQIQHQTLPQHHFLPQQQQQYRISQHQNSQLPYSGLQHQPQHQHRTSPPEAAVSLPEGETLISNQSLQVAPVYVASGAETATTASVTDLATGSNAVVSEDSLQNIPAASAKKVRKPRKDKGNKRAIGSVADIPSGIVTASGPDAVVGSPAHGGSTPNGGGASSSKRKQRKSAVTVAEDDGVSKDVAATNVGVDVSSPASAVHRAGDGSDTTNMTPVAPSHFEGTIENQEHNPLDHEMVVEGKISGDTTNDAEERGESQIPADSAQEVQHAEDVAMAEPAEVPSAPEVSVDPGISVEDGEVVDGEIDRMDVDARE